MNTNADRPKTSSRRGGSFREDLTQRLGDPAFAKEFREAHERASIGLKIARMRSARGMSQSQLAARVHTSQSVISRYESADYDSFRVDTLRRLADALGAELTVDLKEPVQR